MGVAPAIRACSFSVLIAIFDPGVATPCCGTDGGDGDGQGPRNWPEALISAPQAKKILA